MSGHLEAKSFVESEDFRMASREEKADDSSILEKNVPRCIERISFVSGRRGRLLPSILPVSLCPHNIGLLGCNVGRCYL